MFLVCDDDSEVISFVNGMPGSAASVSTLADAYAYLASNDIGFILTSREYPIKTDELRLDLNTQMPSSYPQTGTSWYDLSGNENNATLTGVVVLHVPSDVKLKLVPCLKSPLIKVFIAA